MKKVIWLFPITQTVTSRYFGLMTICKEAYIDHTAFDKKAKYYDQRVKEMHQDG